MKFLNKNTGEVVEFGGTYINSALVSAQNRLRMYWTNFEVTQPRDKGILLKDIIEHPMDDKYKLSDEAIARFKPCQKTNSGQIGTTAHEGKIGQRDRVYDADGKMVTLTATIYKQPPQYAIMGGAIRGRYNADGSTSQKLECNGKEKTNSLTTVQKDNVVVLKNESATKDNKSYSLTASYGGAVAWNSCQKKQRTMIPVAESIDENPNQYNGILYRKLTPLECERLQTLPDFWTDCISNTQRYKSIGNGWTIDVIAHILGCAMSLEYRRANNIFEVGDYILTNDDASDGKVYEIEKNHFNEHFKIRSKDGFRYCRIWRIERHATNEEIKAGRRLSKIKCWSCDKEMSHSDRAENDGFCIHCNAEIEL